MIVEDEPLIRAGLKKYFDWEDFGIHTIVEAENGNEGMNIALLERPDLIITDIHMPEMNGLEMIRQLRPKLPDTLFIILTGHNEFKYAQKAIHYGGVHDFLLKPLQYAESSSTILDCLDKLKKMKIERQTQLMLANEIENNLQLKTSQAVKLILQDNVPVHENSIQHFLTFSSETYMYQILVLTSIPDSISLSYQKKIWSQSEAENVIAKIVSHMVHPTVNRQILTYFYKSKLYAIVVYGTHDKLTVNQVTRNEIGYNLKEIGSEHQLSLFLSIGEPIDNFSRIRKSLQPIENALYERFFNLDTHVFSPKKVDHVQDPHVQLDDENKRLILSLLESGNSIEIKKIMKYLAQSIPHTSSEKWFTFLQEIISVIRQFAHKNEILIEGVYNESLLNLTCVDDFYSFEDLFEWIAAWMIHLGEIFLEKVNQIDVKDIELFKKIESFIIEHINQDLTLNMIAEHFFYNPSYLSRLFKTKLNKNYMTFVREIRINYAQQLLDDSKYSIVDICNLSGYKSYKHFVKVFKSVTKMTPTEYRKYLRS